MRPRQMWQHSSRHGWPPVHKFTLTVCNQRGDTWEKTFYHHNNSAEEVRKVHWAMGLRVESCHLEEKVY